MTFRSWCLSLPLLATGCDLFDKTRDTIEGVVEPQVAVGIVARVSPPQDIPPEYADTLTLPEDLDPGTGVTFFLADASSVSELEEAPIDDATLVLRGCDDEADVPSAGSGAYAAAGLLMACAQADMSVVRTDTDPVAKMPVTIPAEANPDVPTTWTAGDELVLDLSNAGWDSAIVVVVEAESGTVTYTSEPEGIRGWYELLRGQQDLTAVTIPGTAFAEDRVHVVAITGLVRTRAADLDEVNTVLSTVAGGRTTVHGVSTRSLE